MEAQFACNWPTAQKARVEHVHIAIEGDFFDDVAGPPIAVRTKRASSRQFSFQGFDSGSRERGGLCEWKVDGKVDAVFAFERTYWDYERYFVSLFLKVRARLLRDALVTDWSPEVVRAMRIARNMVSNQA